MHSHDFSIGDHWLRACLERFPPVPRLPRRRSAVGNHAVPSALVALSFRFDLVVGEHAVPSPRALVALSLRSKNGQDLTCI